MSLPTAKKFKVCVVKAFNDNYIWLLVNQQNQAIIIDPGDFAKVQSLLIEKNLQLCAIWLTHHHHDHIGGVKQLVENYPVPVFGPSLEAKHVVTHPVREKDIIALPHFPTFIVLETPGHTLGHIVYYGANNLFCGDTLFGAGCGRLFEGTAEQLYSSLLKLAALPDETLVYCAHEYTEQNLKFALTLEPNNRAIAARLTHTKMLGQQNKPSVPFMLAEEKKTNPFLRCHVPELIEAVEKRVGIKLPSFVSVFKQIRLFKDVFKA